MSVGSACLRICCLYSIASFKPDFLSKKQQRNRGELEKAYVSKGHEAIIAPALFDEVQGLTGKKNPWSTRIVCGKCGRPYRIKTRHGKACLECMDSYKSRIHARIFICMNRSGRER